MEREIPMVIEHTFGFLNKKEKNKRKGNKKQYYVYLSFSFYKCGNDKCVTRNEKVIIKQVFRTLFLNDSYEVTKMN